MADHHAPASIELIPVKAEDIMAERRGFYDAFMSGSKYAVIATAVILVLMAIFLL